MPNTTNYSITYPASTDLVASGATQMQTIATGTDTALSTQAGTTWGRNWIDNPNGELNYRNGQSNYLADRWYKNSASVTATSARTAITPATTGLPYFTTWSMTNSITVNSSATASIYDMEQFIDDVRLLAGQTVKISFYAKANTAGLKVGVAVDQHFGTGGTPSATVNNVATLVTLTTSWARYTVSFAVPSISGKTLGTNDDHASFLRFYLSAGSNFSVQANSLGLQTGTWDITSVQLELGYVTPFENRPRWLEEIRCARYFETSLNEGIWLSAGGAGLAIGPTGAGTIIVSGTSESTGIVWFSQPWRTPKRYLTGLTLVPIDPITAAGPINSVYYWRSAAQGTIASTTTGTTTRHMRIGTNISVGAAWVPCTLWLAYAASYTTTGIYL